MTRTRPTPHLHTVRITEWGINVSSLAKKKIKKICQIWDLLGLAKQIVLKTEPKIHNFVHMLQI